ncbi:hypothetical protein BTE28158_03830 [Burkholderia territorii]|nr:hypothetical protein BTE28158_03830 [Burkholderia territorii]
MRYLISPGAGIACTGATVAIQEAGPWRRSR